jgi:S-methylmethionine-dependent homocysteine/selenocysteine methylase
MSDRFHELKAQIFNELQADLLGAESIDEFRAMIAEAHARMRLTGSYSDTERQFI